MQDPFAMHEQPKQPEEPKKEEPQQPEPLQDISAQAKEQQVPTLKLEQPEQQNPLEHPQI